MYNLEFKFKGNRNYVQGPDVLNGSFQKLEENFIVEKISNIKYSAHNMLHCNAKMTITQNFVENNYSNINSIITFVYENKKYYIVIEEDKTSTIEVSKNYDENIVVSNSIIVDDIIEFKNILKDSLSEIIVSMNKHFLTQKVLQKGKWVLTKFEYIRWIEENYIKNKRLKLNLTHNFNNKLTKSEIFIENEFVGFVYFSLI